MQAQGSTFQPSCFYGAEHVRRSLHRRLLCAIVWRCSPYLPQLLRLMNAHAFNGQEKKFSQHLIYYLDRESVDLFHGDTESASQVYLDAIRKTFGRHVCQHMRRFSTCPSCKGGSVCKHRRQRIVCKECGGRGICLHNRRKSLCKDCGGGSICRHQKVRSVCKDCGGGSICAHNKERRYCKVCT